MKRLILLLPLVTALTLLGLTEAVAQQQGEQLGEKPSEQLDARDATLATLPSDTITASPRLGRHLNLAERHEVRVGIAYNPYTPHDYAPNFDWRDYPYDLPENSTLGKTRWFTVNADYGYWPLRWLYVGGVASWSGGFGRVSSTIDHSRIDCYNYHALSLMPIVRFGWLNRSIVQLYSGVGIAAMMAIYASGASREPLGRRLRCHVHRHHGWPRVVRLLRHRRWLPWHNKRWHRIQI